MATPGQDCEIVLDGNGYFVKPGTYVMKQPRIRKATIRADGGESYVDLGPGKREWSMVLLCVNDLLKYDGTPTGMTGQQYRDALRTSYNTNVGGTLSFNDPLANGAYFVHFDSYAERILDLHTQIIAVATGGALAASYEVGIVLTEA